MKLLALLLLSALIFAACTQRTEYAPANVAAAPDAININTATVAELEALPHIGRKTAENIVRFREENGPFRRVEHVLQIRGMSESRFAEIRPHLRTE